jgi:serine/threonine protein kinase
VKADPHVGRVLGGRYRVVRLIRAGGMGAVYEAMQEGLGRRVALKILTAATSPASLVRFRKEAEAAARLGNPHIVQVSDFGTTPGDPPFMVMELLQGSSLADVIAQGPIPWQRATRIALQVLAALVAAHDAKIVHRDIKPDNVFLVSSLAMQDMVKVLDFGVAKLLEPGDEPPLTTEGVAVGTPAYMAPEQARAQPVDERTDIYAVGLCLYEAVTGGRLPIESDNLYALRLAIATAPAVPLEKHRPDIDRRFASVVERAIAKEPRDRFANARAMADALAACLEIEPVPPTIPETEREPDVSPQAGSVIVPEPATTAMPALAPRPIPPHPLLPMVRPRYQRPASTESQTTRLILIAAAIGLALALLLAFIRVMASRAGAPQTSEIPDAPAP